MTEASWPSPNHGTPARSVTDAEYPHLAPWASDGVFPSSSDVVYANSSGMQVHVRAGKYAIVRGHAWTSGGSEYNLTVAANSSGSTRVDTVVLRLDRSTWDVTAVVRQGTPGSGAPTLQRDTGDTGLWEIPLADVTVPNGVSSIAAGNVKTRTLSQSNAVRVCGVITDIQATLTTGDIVYEAQNGRWLGWTGSNATVMHWDTGDIPLAIGGSTWTSAGLTGRRVGDVVSLNINVIRAGSTFVTSDPDGSRIVAPIDTRLRPRRTEYTAGQFTGGADSVRVEVRTDGSVWVAYPSENVAVGRYLRSTITYLA